MITRVFCTVLMLLSVTSSYAQLYDTTYYNKEGSYVQKENAVTYKIISRYADRQGFYHVGWYFANGTLASKGVSFSSTGLPYIGRHTAYYTNGAKQKEGEYKKAKWNTDKTVETGNWTFWDEQGRKTVEMEYVQDEAKKTTIEHYLNAWDTTGMQILTNGNGEYITSWCLYQPDTNCFTLKGKVENSLPHGEWLCMRNGMYISYREKYDKGEFISGISFDTKGKKYTYTQKEVLPEFPGGDSALIHFLATNTNYPVLERDNDIQGRVVVGFVVAENGAITDVRILRSISPGLDQEAVRVVKLLPSFKPGTRLGQPVKVQYNLPVGFKLE